ncbi:MAG: hypothetical protein AB7E60_02805 [Sphingobium sp.]
MTPLAHRIVKELTLPVKDRTFNDQCGLLQRMDDVHCFDATEVFNLAGALSKDLHKSASASGFLDIMEAQTFLPAPRTWIEWKYSNGAREGVLMEQRNGFAVCDWAVWQDDLFASNKRSGALLMEGGSTPVNQGFPCVRDVGDEPREVMIGYVVLMYALLAIINTPRLIGRKQHMPHRGLERRLAKTKGLVGKFPLHAWTELKLSVSDIGKRADGTEHEAHYTGEKCLHFCRAHIRIKRGKLERVSAHWRGNPALGIKRTRYKLAA